jgi:hypothetical protein
MSDIESYEPNHDVDYNQYSAGQEHAALDQLHQAQGSESDYNSQFGVYEADHHAAEHDEFATGHHVEYDAPAQVHYEETDYTNASHSAEVDDHVFAAEGSEHAHQAQYSELDALKERFDSAFVEGTEYHGGEAEIAAK